MTPEEKQKIRPRRNPTRKGEHDLEWDAYRKEAEQREKVRRKEYYERKHAANEAGSQKALRSYDTVMTALTKQAATIPFSSQQYTDAVDAQREQTLNDAQIYKNAVNSLITLGELGFSGTSLLGAYANWKKWANSANVLKNTMANLLQRAQMPAQIGGTIIDGAQTYSAAQENNDFEKWYNATSGMLGASGAVGASDVFLNSRFHNQKLDRLFDAAGIIQSGGDFIKYGYDQIKPLYDTR